MNRRKLQEELIEQHLGLLQIYDPETADRVSIDKSWKLQYRSQPQQRQFLAALAKRERAATELSRDDLARSSTESKVTPLFGTFLHQCTCLLTTTRHKQQSASVSPPASARQYTPAEPKQAASSKVSPKATIRTAKFKEDDTGSFEMGPGETAQDEYLSAIAKNEGKLDTRECTVDSLEPFDIGHQPRENEVCEEWRTQSNLTQPRYLQVSGARQQGPRPLPHAYHSPVCIDIRAKQNTFGSTLSVDSLLGQQLPATQLGDGLQAEEQEEGFARDSIECKSFQGSMQLDSLSTFPAAAAATARNGSSSADTKRLHRLDATHETQYEDDFEAESITRSNASLHGEDPTCLLVGLRCPLAGHQLHGALFSIDMGLCVQATPAPMPVSRPKTSCCWGPCDSRKRWSRKMMTRYASSKYAPSRRLLVITVEKMSQRKKWKSFR